MHQGGDDLTKLNDILDNTDVIESCSSRKRLNAKWEFFKFIKLTTLAALLKDLTMCCQDANLLEQFLRNLTISCLTFEESTRQPYNDNLCLVFAVALHLLGYQKLGKETCIFLGLFINRIEGLSPGQFQGVHLNVFPNVEDLLLFNILLFDIDCRGEQYV